MLPDILKEKTFDMKIRAIFLSLIFTLLFSENTNSQSIQGSNTLTSLELLKDFEVLKGVLLKYHPGLYRFQDSVTIQKHFDNLQQELNHDMPISEAYLLFSKFTAKSAFVLLGILLI